MKRERKKERTKWKIEVRWVKKVKKRKKKWKANVVNNL